MEVQKFICSIWRQWAAKIVNRVRTRNQPETSMAHRKNTTMIMAAATLFTNGVSCGRCRTSRRTAMTTEKVGVILSYETLQMLKSQIPFYTTILPS